MKRPLGRNVAALAALTTFGFSVFSGTAPPAAAEAAPPPVTETDGVPTEHTVVDRDHRADPPPVPGDQPPEGAPTAEPEAPGPPVSEAAVPGPPGPPGPPSPVPGPDPSEPAPLPELVDTDTLAAWFPAGELGAPDVVQQATGEADGDTGEVRILQHVLLGKVEIVEASTAGSGGHEVRSVTARGVDGDHAVVQLAHAASANGASVSIVQVATAIGIGRGIALGAESDGSARATGSRSTGGIVQVADITARGPVTAELLQWTGLLTSGRAYAEDLDGTPSTASATGAVADITAVQVAIQRVADGSVRIRQLVVATTEGDAAAATSSLATWSADRIATEGEAADRVGAFLDSLEQLLDSRVDRALEGWDVELLVHTRRRAGEIAPRVYIEQRVGAFSLRFSRPLVDPDQLGAELRRTPAPPGGANGDVRALGAVTVADVCQTAGVAPGAASCAPHLELLTRKEEAAPQPVERQLPVAAAAATGSVTAMFESGPGRSILLGDDAPGASAPDGDPALPTSQAPAGAPEPEPSRGAAAPAGTVAAARAGSVVPLTLTAGGVAAAAAALVALLRRRTIS